MSEKRAGSEYLLVISKAQTPGKTTKIMARTAFIGNDLGGNSRVEETGSMENIGQAESGEHCQLESTYQPHKKDSDSFQTGHGLFNSKKRKPNENAGQRKKHNFGGQDCVLDFEERAHSDMNFTEYKNTTPDRVERQNNSVSLVRQKETKRKVKAKTVFCDFKDTRISSENQRSAKFDSRFSSDIEHSAKCDDKIPQDKNSAKWDIGVSSGNGGSAELDVGNPSADQHSKWAYVSPNSKHSATLDWSFDSDPPARSPGLGESIPLPLSASTTDLSGASRALPDGSGGVSPTFSNSPRTPMTLVSSAASSPINVVVADESSTNEENSPVATASDEENDQVSYITLSCDTGNGDVSAFRRSESFSKLDSVTKKEGSPSRNVASSFTHTIDSIVNERGEDKSPTRDTRCMSSRKRSSSSKRPELPDDIIREANGSMLTMGIIGCLPDNVQQNTSQIRIKADVGTCTLHLHGMECQYNTSGLSSDVIICHLPPRSAHRTGEIKEFTAIKSFSIRPGKQHVTFAFPFMTDMIRQCANDLLEMEVDDLVSHALYCDHSTEVIDGYGTFVTLAPTKDRFSLPVVLFTLYQRDTVEGIIAHFQSLVQILLKNRSSLSGWKMPLCVIDIKSSLLDLIVCACVDNIFDAHNENLLNTFPGKSCDELRALIKDKMISSSFRSYEDQLQLNVKEVISKMATMDAERFLSLMDHIRSLNCTTVDYQKANIMIRNVATNPALKSFWRIWSQPQIGSKVFPIAMATRGSPRMDNLVYHAQPVTHVGRSSVPVKEGLQSIIKCLKAQDVSNLDLIQKNDRLKPCSCSVCRPSSLRACSTRSPRESMWNDPRGSTYLQSAFHRPRPTYTDRLQATHTPYSDALKAAATGPPSNPRTHDTHSDQQSGLIDFPGTKVPLNSFNSELLPNLDNNYQYSFYSLLQTSNRYLLPSQQTTPSEPAFVPPFPTQSPRLIYPVVYKPVVITQNF